jgi:neutral ceramidase
MKKTGISIAVIIVALLLVFLICTVRTDTTPYFESAYFKESCRKSDSLDKVTTTIKDRLYAGFARVSITPRLNSTADDLNTGEFVAVPLAGFGDRKGKPATAIHDSIFVKAVALRCRDKLVIIIGADMLIMPPNIADSAAVILAKKGINRDQLIFSATHTHSGPGAWGPGYIGEQFAGKENKNLERWISARIVQAAELAIADLHPAKAGSGNFEAGMYTRNRLIGESGTKNDEFSFICLEQDGKRKAVIGSFSAHATTMGDENMEISGDYPGYWERKVEKAGNDVAVFCAGSVGSQSPAVEGNGFEKPRLIGEALADTLLSHIKNITLNDSIAFSAVSLPMALPAYHMRLTTKINLAAFLSRKLMAAPRNVYLQAIRLNDMIWISTPCDFSGEYALQIRNSLLVKGFRLNVTSFNGNYVGYIIPGKYYYLDKYEPKMMGWFGPNMGDYTVDLIGRLIKIVTKKNNL